MSKRSFRPHVKRGDGAKGHPARAGHRPLPTSEAFARDGGSSSQTSSPGNAQLIHAIADALIEADGEDALDWIEGGGRAAVERGVAGWRAAIAEGAWIHRPADILVLRALRHVERVDPGAAGRGLSLSLTPAWGADSGNAERLWGHADARGLAANDGFEPAGRLDAEAGWGLGAFGGRGLATPFAGLALSDAGERTWRSGVRWTVGPDTAFGVEGTLREAANDNAGEHGVLFKFTSRW